MVKSKRGAIEAYQIIITIIAILSLLAGLFVWYNLRPLAENGDQICRFSVLLRATSPEAAQSFIPLKCSTQKICITLNGSRCDAQFAGEKDVTIVELKGSGSSLNEAEISDAAKIIEMTSADAMLNCWNNMYGGKFDLFGNYATRTGFIPGGYQYKSHCVVCSRVAIDNSVTDSILKEVNLQRYMQNNVPDGQSSSYLQLLTDNQFSSFPIVNNDVYKNLVSNSTQQITSDNLAKNRQAAYVFMQIKAPNVGTALTSLGTDVVAAAGAVMVASPKIGFRAISLGAKNPGILASVAVVGTANTVLSVLVGQSMAAAYCGPFTSQNTKNNNEGGKNGCSLVEAVPYTPGALNQLCASYEGNL